MEFKLVITRSPDGMRKYLSDSEIRIGRDSSNDVVLSDRAVSLVHCRLYVEDATCYVQDLGSTNGVRLNGRRVISAELSDGDSLQIGSTLSRVELPGHHPARAQDARLKDRIVDAPTEIVESRNAGSIFGSVSYFLKRQLAVGGMGAVYEAEQYGAEGFIKRVAIKTILPEFVKKDSFVASFVGEAKLAANLVHPNIAQVHHLGRHDGGYYIAMEYIDGWDLNTLMGLISASGSALPVGVAAKIILAVARGLDYAHGMCDADGQPLRLVHRDVSPSNILISREGEIKLTDFGVARASQFMHEDKEELVGSIEFMAPEQAACSEVDARTDLFTLGLVWYEMLTDHRPLKSRDLDVETAVAKAMSATIPDPLTYRPDLPEGTVNAMMRCLHKIPDDRFASAAELCHAIADLPREDVEIPGGYMSAYVRLLDPERRRTTA